MSNAPEIKRCPKCGGILPEQALQGLCPKCLFLAASTPTETGQPAGDRPAPPPLEVIAAAFPQLEILEFIGQGGMGFVFKARQPKLDRLVALKILPQSLAADPTFAERFNREARLLARLSHPGIVTVHDFGVADVPAGILPAVEPGFQPGGKIVDSSSDVETSGASDISHANPGGKMPPSTSGRMPNATPQTQFYYLLMEFVDGVNLRQAMQAGRFTPDQALAIVPKICEALQFAHNEGILHRDIKPENILLDAKGRVKIADFGIAKLVERGCVADQSQQDGADNALRLTEDGTAALPNLTEAGKALGTPNYMAPEQRDCSGEVDHRADIYSLGVVFYEMLTGELPLGRFAPPSEKSAADPRVDEVVLRALEKEKAKRHASADEVRTQVETIVTTRSRSSGRESAQTESESGNGKSVQGITFGQMAVGFFIAAVLGAPLLWNFMGAQEVILLCGAALLLSLVLGLMSWRTKGGNIAALASGVGLLLLAAFTFSFLAPAPPRGPYEGGGKTTAYTPVKGNLSAALSARYGAEESRFELGKPVDVDLLFYNNSPIDIVVNPQELPPTAWLTVTDSDGTQVELTGKNKAALVLKEPRIVKTREGMGGYAMSLLLLPKNDTKTAQNAKADAMAWVEPGTYNLQFHLRLPPTSYQPDGSSKNEYRTVPLTIEVKGPNAMVAAEPVKQRLSFGPVIERVVTMDKDWVGDALLEFETGKLISGPTNGDAASGLSHLLKDGVNVGFDAAKQETTLLGSGGTVLVDAALADWDTLSATKVEQRMKNERSRSGLSLSGAGHGLPPMTLLFKTGGERAGLLQITSFTENPRGVKIRYKLVQNTSGEPNSISTQPKELKPIPPEATRLLADRECIVERAPMPEETAGLQVFRWNYSIPPNHVATFRFVMATNSSPQWVDGLTLWFAAGTNQPAKGFIQWSKQDGRTLSPELDQQDRWDMIFRTAEGGGSGFSQWMNKSWKDALFLPGSYFRIKPGSAEDLWAHFKRVEGKSQFANQADMYGSNYVLMQVSLEVLPPGLTAGDTGFGSSGTNWADLLPRLMRAKNHPQTNSATAPQSNAPAEASEPSEGRAGIQDMEDLQKQRIGEMRHMLLAMRMYAEDNVNWPATLAQAFPYLDDRVRKAVEAKAGDYRYQLPDANIIMSENSPRPVLFEATPLRTDGKLLGFSDGSVMFLRDATPRPNSLSPVTNAPPATAPNLSFGPVMERTVYDYRSGKDWLLNLETGKTFSLPPGLDWDKNADAVWKWAHQQGIHVTGLNVASQHGLYGFEMKAALFQDKGALFETVSADAITNAMKGSLVSVSTHNGGPPLYQLWGNNWQSLFAFETDQGVSGVLQVTGFTDNPRGVKLRYKLVETEKK